MANKMQKLKTVLRWIFNILCLLVVSFLFLVGIWTRNLYWLWLIVPIALWVAAFKRKLAGWLALGFLATIVGIVVWLFLPDSGNWRLYNFDYELKDLEARRAVPDAENAAIAYQNIIARLDVNNAPPFYNDVNEPSTHIVWKGSDHPETAAFIDARIDIITDVMTASTMEKCAFSIWTNPMNMLADTFSGMRKMAYLVISAANRDMGEGRTDEALKKYESAIRMGRQLELQPMIIHFLVGMAIENLGSSRVSSAIITTDLTQAQLDNIRQILSPTADDWPQIWLITSQYEKMLVKNLFGQMYYEINDGRIVRFRINPMPFPQELLKSLPPPTALHYKLTKLSTIGLWFFCPHNPKELSRMYDEEFERVEKLYDANRPQSESKPDVKPSFNRWLKNPHRAIAYMMAQMVMPTYTQFHKTYLRAIVHRRVIHVLLAMREYRDAIGRWPESLDQIKDKVPAEAMIDPLTGGSFIYKTKGDKFLLYSVGANKIDEKGKPKPSCRDGVCKTERSPSDDILIWPQKYEQAKEFFDADKPSLK